MTKYIIKNGLQEYLSGVGGKNITGELETDDRGYLIGHLNFKQIEGSSRYSPVADLEGRVEVIGARDNNGVTFMILDPNSKTEEPRAILLNGGLGSLVVLNREQLKFPSDSLNVQEFLALNSILGAYVGRRIGNTLMDLTAS